jgi:hypothetical protein
VRKIQVGLVCENMLYVLRVRNVNYAGAKMLACGAKMLACGAKMLACGAKKSRCERNYFIPTWNAIK